ncbi:DUF2218 domain-containing protein [Saccharobesus litoralis]|uniref:DUF2218 domain-containing protein n=1 Tax=Saccharobesus litoralis TaxID=2172099 RepID=A0A2S0VPL4_9ALTE|nr:DUF2218 domain-containing protein [Saccharobesus litoralis]AWB66133.1 DUF2218 domain-containing protein [Saccharobesus litoralis]
MSIINQVQSQQTAKFKVIAAINNLDSSRMIKRLCKHYSHKVDAGWNQNQGYIQFAMGFCDLQAKPEHLTLTCWANSQAELEEIAQCVARHFARFIKQPEMQLTWNSPICET